MAKRIEISLPENRLNIGTLKVLDEDGNQLLADIECRGKADNQRAAKRGNPLRHSTYPYGDTPSGEYAPTKCVVFREEIERFGIGWIPMEGISGDAHLAKDNGRTGLAIHGGRGNERLVPTFGCVRVRDIDFRHMAHVLGDDDIAISIKDTF
ncbi:hypothetical protein BN1012_Phect2613 [Candidatus Phaeomarinobacter ectocarpi]|uniref:YkuD domain-containing protein n=1 Tax=Candidatus Phaeomarinibacter ectocarpi TaxID=1458461 RepID=X5MP30_9HYPH|nr:hypothetical protein [Candidatus Phaeomarinobacter ectocarpi]CDO60826.1 hypothetical protein BN1012_Phect2613 [Candidatus Phaeomarinobacter ectocarpi]